ncbi:hypothetical protein CIHG_09246 [Coccidioides immitis H538.4]|uniref:Uncharacterized protein n=4 Tax=Coccidioides TaxID=5500 RepID=A0A0J8R7B5_COCIT|nr:hypothetical protein CPAG_09476 [Coccidioides posadasii RMSCC 3488]KMP08097.1 hypothetical protein CIRG_07778 [Coccidioides immitis RMSCC 2394]KMU79618.1 hypothetical protein CISG_02036 [Coccidioides immitis RMSCC 3703]KMU91494.1 hypothetical protein CIHG_09246 [Coccidioides immitis H538.4]
MAEIPKWTDLPTVVTPRSPIRLVARPNWNWPFIRRRDCQPRNVIPFVSSPGPTGEVDAHRGGVTQQSPGECAARPESGIAYFATF